MLTKKTKILIASLTILLIAVLMSYWALNYSVNIRQTEKDDCAKLTELEAALIKAASKSQKQEELSYIKSKYTGDSPKARPTLGR